MNQSTEKAALLDQAARHYQDVFIIAIEKGLIIPSVDEYTAHWLLANRFDGARLLDGASHAAALSLMCDMNCLEIEQCQLDPGSYYMGHMWGYNAKRSTLDRYNLKKK